VTGSPFIATTCGRDEGGRLWETVVHGKGFGFVADESGHEYDFHQSACQSFQSLREGQAVTFQAAQGPKGPRAENIREA
jgi:CspA family cold shock protein